MKNNESEIKLNGKKDQLKLNINKSQINGIVHPEMRILSVSPHHCADGGWVKCSSPQHTSGVSGVNSEAAESNTIEEISDPSPDVKNRQNKNTTCLHTARVESCTCPEAETIKFDSVSRHLHQVSIPKVHWYLPAEVHSGTVRNSNVCWVDFKD